MKQLELFPKDTLEVLTQDLLNDSRYVRIVNQLTQMLRIQDGLNQKNSLDWRSQDYDWSTAILVESAELLDELDWKWWKSYPYPNKGLDKARMELVDIWHFLLSKVMQTEYSQGFSLDLMARAVYDLPEASPDSKVSVKSVIASVKQFLMGITVFDYSVLSVKDFLAVMSELNMSFDSLYSLYVGKAELNKLRWENGYGTTYHKVWIDLDDSSYLTLLLQGLSIDPGSEEYLDAIKDGLAARYLEVQKYYETRDAMLVKA